MWSRIFTSGFRWSGHHRSEHWPWWCTTAAWKIVEHAHPVHLGAQAGLYLPFYKLEWLLCFLSLSSFFLRLSNLMLEQSCELWDYFPPFDLPHFSSLWQEKKLHWHSFQGHWNVWFLLIRDVPVRPYTRLRHAEQPSWSTETYNPTQGSSAKQQYNSYTPEFCMSHRYLHLIY